MRVSGNSSSSECLTLDFEGRPMPAFMGETVAAALMANGVLKLSSGRDESARGYFCGMGLCHDCLVTIDGTPSQRSCMTKVSPGMSIRRQATLPAVRTDNGKISIARQTKSVDILVVGAGPAGLAAALAAARAKASVLVLDERPAPGGQYFKQPAYDGAVPKSLRDEQGRKGASLIEQVRQAGVVLWSSALVWGAFRVVDGGIEIAAVAEGTAISVTPRVIIIATGAYERPTIVPGWTLPGVMTPGAAQTLLRSYGVVPGSRVLIAGNGPLNLQLADEFRRAGLREIIVAEAASPPWSHLQRGLTLASSGPRFTVTGFRTIASLRMAGIPIFWRHTLMRVEGQGRAERAVIARLDKEGRPESGKDSVFSVDAVMASSGFLPTSELPRQLGCIHRAVTTGSMHLEVERDDDGSTSCSDVFVVGEAGGFGGAQIALAQGTLGGNEAARRLGFSPAIPTGRATRTVEGHRRFQRRLWTLFATSERGLECANADTVVCRCEAVTLGQLKHAITSHGAGDIATLKRLTRAGMGRCQARYCGTFLHNLVETIPSREEDFLASTPPLRPVPLGFLASSKPEWFGHKRTLMPRFDQRDSAPITDSECATVVIGAGVVGLATAYYLSQAGHDVIIVERGWPNASASGGNAGSLHAQLLSFDFHQQAAAGGMTPAMRTLPLQKASIALWQDLQTTLGGDIEVKITGGLMVAENEDDLRRLVAKTAVERAQGIGSEMIDQSTLRSLEPVISPNLVGAAFCPIEGKINPLVATQALADAASRSGARVYANCNVTAITRDNSGFHLQTSRGRLHAGRVVNAAGPFARTIGALLGVEIPVFGAPLQMIVTEAVAPCVSHLIAHASKHLSLKQTANGNILIGGGWYAGLDTISGRACTTREALEGNVAVAQSVVPSLAEVHLLRSWAAMNIDIDGAPILGEHPAVPGFYTAVGANGYTLAPVFGLTIADLILRGRAERDIAPFSISRFG